MALHGTPIGHHIHFPAYTSTSTNYETAKQFAHTVYGSEEEQKGGETRHMHKHVIHFHLPQGYNKGRHVRNISDLPNEHEMILHHGQTFKKVGYHHEQDHSFETNDRFIHHHHFVPVE
jgi:hypothetical protein